MDKRESSAPRAPRPDTGDVAGRIRRDAAAHPERTYCEHVEAAEQIVAVEYRAEIRRMMAAGTLDPDDEL